MPDEIEDTKRLSPEERITKLKALSKKHEEEIKKAQELMKQSEAELEEDAKSSRQIPIPQLRAVDVGALFGKGTQEDLMHEMKQFRSSKKEEEKEEEPQSALEETVERDKRARLTSQSEADQRGQYAIAEIRYGTIEQTKTRLNELKNEFYQAVERYGSPNDELIGKIDHAMYAIKAKAQDGHYVEEAWGMHQALQSLKERYKGR